MFILFVITFNFEDKEAALLTNVITFILISQSVKTIDTYFQANVISKFSSIANSLSFFLSSAIKLLFIYIEADLVYFAYLLVFDSVVIALGYVTVYSLEKKSVFALKFDYGVASFFVRKGWPLMLVTLAVFIYSKIDQIMIKHLVDNEAVGNYAAAYRISEFAYFIPILFAQSVFPKIVELKQKSEIDYFRFLEKIYKVLVWIGIFISLALFMFSDFIVSVLFGHQYVQASSILSILSFTVVLNSIGVISSKIIYVEHYERKYLYRSILGVLVNIALNYWLIGLYGALGAAISTVITLIVIYYIYDIFDKDLHKFFYLKLQCFIPFNLRKKGMK
jgi:O-antigen/teichoic acid export membrane protein